MAAHWLLALLLQQAVGATAPQPTTAAPAAAPAPAAGGAAVATPAERQARQREVLAPLKAFNGEWRGRSEARVPGSPPRVLQATYRVGEMLDGTVRLAEGRSFQPDGRVGVNTLHVIQHDPDTRRTSLRVQYGGRLMDHGLTLVDGGYDFVIRPPGEQLELHYEVRVRDGVWTENGVAHVPGQPPTPYFQMVLERVGDSEWPEAGALQPRPTTMPAGR